MDMSADEYSKAQIDELKKRIADPFSIEGILCRSLDSLLKLERHASARMASGDKAAYLPIHLEACHRIEECRKMIQHIRSGLPVRMLSTDAYDY